MSVSVNWADIAGGLILLCLATVITAGWFFAEQQKINAEEQRQRRGFERDMTDVELPPWNGETYDWPPDLARYLADPYGYQMPAQPVPPSPVSGPLPQLGTHLDDEAFITAMRSRTDQLIARLGEGSR